eukprot:m.49299 g.49299  ORF g.49299 m.49299 type:complete len:714 (+) comp7102_c1_seq2:511-2652(+)
MRCHYDVLGVELDATDAELKKAYRRKALQWHPDKNADNSEEATLQFQLIQAAYAVLSDPHERQWYDDHRESILRGDDGDGDDVGDGIDLMKYFSPSCFRGYGDGDGGFYKTYAQVFDTIWANERYDVEGKADPPPFGDDSSDYVSVVKPFYRYWTNFTTANTFASKDKWDTREAPNRQVKRLMEKENRKLRDGAKKTFTQTVRQLASFVQGLDRKRKMRYQAEAAAEREKDEHNRKATEEAERRKRVAELDAMLESEAARQDWDELERELELLEETLDADFETGPFNAAASQVPAGAEADSQDAVGDADAGGADGQGMADTVRRADGGGRAPAGPAAAARAGDQWACVACNKRFKSERQFDNHQRSKKHLAAVAELREYMEDEDALFASSAGRDDTGAGTSPGHEATRGAYTAGRGSQRRDETVVLPKVGGAEGAIPLPADFDFDMDVDNIDDMNEEDIDALLDLEDALEQQLNLDASAAHTTTAHRDTKKKASRQSASQRASSATDESSSDSDSTSDVGDDDILARMVMGRKTTGGSAAATTTTPSANGDRGGGPAVDIVQGVGSQEDEAESVSQEENEEEEASHVRRVAEQDAAGATDEGSTQAQGDEGPTHPVVPHSEVPHSQPGPTKGPRRKKKKKGGDRMVRVPMSETADTGGLPVPTEGDLACQVCGQPFDSRNKLFRHIESTGHAILRDVSGGGGGKGKKGKKKKK